MISTLVLALAANATPVTKVTVYPDRAEVVRTVEIACGAHAEVKFGGIPPSADPSSFRTTVAAGAGTVDGQRVEVIPRSAAFSPEVEALDKKIEAQRDKLTELDDAIRDANVRSEIGGGYNNLATQLIQREMIEAPNVKAWAAALDSTLKALLDAASERTKLGTKRRELVRDLDSLQRRRSMLSAQSARSEFEVDALVSCPAGKRASVQLSYLVGGARWRPSYEARSSGTKVDLATFATVSQETGEDWSHAELVLSTALPRKDATPPQPQPLRVWADSRQPPRKVLTTRESYTEHAESAPRAPGASGGEGGGKNVIVNQGLSVQIRVPERADVRGDGTPARLAIGSVQMAAQPRLKIAPRQYPFAFRVAELQNAAPYPLLRGPIDVFSRGELLARYDLEEVAMGARFSLTFGVEDRVKVDRSTQAEGTRDRSFTGLSRRRQFAYEIYVASYLPGIQEVEVTEQVPVSELDDVKVSLDKTTTAGFTLDPADGLLVWKLKLNPGEKKKLGLKFSVDVPASYDSEGT